MGGQKRVAALAASVEAGDVTAVSIACHHDGGRPVSAAERTKAVAAARTLLAKRWDRSAVLPAQQEAAAIVWTALATTAEQRRLRGGVIIPKEPHLAVRILSARDPEFRTDWVARAFATSGPKEISVAQELIEAGLAPWPASDDWVLWLIAWPDRFAPPGRFEGQHRIAALDLLRSRPDLAGVVWRFFEIEGGGDRSLAAHDKYESDPRTWRHAVVTLSAEGVLDRGRLLDASLDALQRGFAPFRAQWFSTLHEALAPTLVERVERRDTYLEVLASPVATTTTMALKALATMQKANALDGPTLIDHIAPAMHATAASSAKLAIGLVATAVDQDPALGDAASSVMAQGLDHAKADVQALALRRIRGWTSTPSDELRRPILRSAPACHPSVRTEIEEWIGSVADARPPDPSPIPIREVRHISVKEFAVLVDVEPLVIPTDLAEILERASALLEDPAGADEIEAVLAAAAQLGRAAVEGDRRAATLGRRAAKAIGSDRPSRQLIAIALTAWLAPDLVPDGVLGCQLPSPPEGDAHRLTLDGLLGSWVLALAEGIRAGSGFQPLATPTHRGGMLDPLVFAERIAASPPGPEDSDLAVALLRLAPDAHRLEEAVELLPKADPLGVRRWMAGWAARCEADFGAGASWSKDRWRLVVEPLADLALEPARVIVSLIPLKEWGSVSGRFDQDFVGVAWLGSALPSLPETWARLGTAAIGPTHGSMEVAHGDAAYLHRLFEERVPLCEGAHLLLALALSDPRPSIFPLAVDVAVAATKDGRLDPALLGQQIGRLAGKGVVTEKRWGRTLGDLAEVSPLHRLAARDVLEHAVGAAEPAKPQDLLALVDLLEVILLESGGIVNDPGTRSALGRIGGAGKTAATAKRLLAMGVR